MDVCYSMYSTVCATQGMEINGEVIGARNRRGQRKLKENC